MIEPQVSPYKMIRIHISMFPWMVLFWFAFQLAKVGGVGLRLMAFCRRRLDPIWGPNPGPPA